MSVDPYSDSLPPPIDGAPSSRPPRGGAPPPPRLARTSGAIDGMKGQKVETPQTQFTNGQAAAMGTRYQFRSGRNNNNNNNNNNNRNQQNNHHNNSRNNKDPLTQSGRWNANMFGSNSGNHNKNKNNNRQNNYNNNNNHSNNNRHGNNRTQQSTFSSDVCKSWQQFGNCSYGASCRYMHSSNHNNNNNNNNSNNNNNNNHHRGRGNNNNNHHNNHNNSNDNGAFRLFGSSFSPSSSMSAITNLNFGASGHNNNNSNNNSHNHYNNDNNNNRYNRRNRNDQQSGESAGLFALLASKIDPNVSNTRVRYQSMSDGDDFTSSSSSSSTVAAVTYDFHSTTPTMSIPSIFDVHPSSEMKINQVSLAPINWIPSGTLLPEYRSHSLSTLTPSGIVLMGGDEFITPSMFPPQSKNQCHLLQILDGQSSSQLSSVIPRAPSSLTSTFLTSAPFQSINGHSLHYMSTLVLGVDKPLQKVFTCCGFINGNISNEIYSLELATGRWSLVNALGSRPLPRAFHSSISYPRYPKEKRTHPLNTKYDIFVPTASQPTPYSASTTEMDSKTNHTPQAILTFGGLINENTVDASTYMFEPDLNRWSRIRTSCLHGDGPNARAHHAAHLYALPSPHSTSSSSSSSSSSPSTRIAEIFYTARALHQSQQANASDTNIKEQVIQQIEIDTRDLTMIIYGGSNGNTIFDDMWALHLDTFEWRQLEARTPFKPEARIGFGSFLLNHNFFIFGGRNPTRPNRPLRDMWRFDLHNFIWEQVPLPSSVLELFDRSNAQATITKLDKAPLPMSAKANAMQHHYHIFIFGGETSRGKTREDSVFLTIECSST